MYGWVVGLIKVALSAPQSPASPFKRRDSTRPDYRSKSPVYLLKEAQPWLANPDYPRRGSVSAFGFGGTNFHAVLEEYRGEVEESAPGVQTWPYELFVLRAENRESLAKEVQLLKRCFRIWCSPDFGI
jgi:acyl transferase domain-containing protein